VGESEISTEEDDINGSWLKIGVAQTDDRKVGPIFGERDRDNN
jgi:hypothetical protein